MARIVGDIKKKEGKTQKVPSSQPGRDPITVTVGRNDLHHNIFLFSTRNKGKRKKDRKKIGFSYYRAGSHSVVVLFAFVDL